ncbi:DUF1236 domain-containing protein [Bradyrhizobium sp. CCGUVB14]|uniref:DUF1236 domain-containing protein n=1 Tax=Bradyrhizobium sp. CCGUVB14 TaxID=2949628 RepID=UPI0020B212D6|nr:DUF1236 domain-containing protein [Bradyrhizobium sp. CCGUVB14]MCP3442236.1 DUF1236 domain-containing protein [Bradyrhizobium sp. CCGUVB14]
MNKRILLATTAFVAIATSALAQSSPNTSTTAPSAQRQQDSMTSTSTPATTNAPSASTTSPSTSSTTPTGSAQTSNPSSTNSAQTQAPSTSNQSASGQSTGSGSNTSTSQAPATSTSPSQAQTNTTNPPSNQAQTSQPSSGQTQSANPPATGSNQAQQNQTGSNSTNAAQRTDDRQNNFDRSSTNVNASVNINDQQRTRVSQSIARLDVRPLTSVNFSVSVGTVVPRDVRLQQLPADVVEIVPQYRGYDFVVVKDEIVIVEPSSYKIVATLPYSGRSTASAPARSEERKTTFSDRDREVIRKHAKARPVEREKHVTTGSTVRTEIRTGERVPEGVEVETFPEEVYRDAPTLREYRYINRDSHTYIVEPRERRVIEEID